MEVPLNIQNNVNLKNELIYMGEKKESFLSDNIRIWMHNEAEAQKAKEENQQDFPKEQMRK